MRGEQESRQLLLDLGAWPEEYNASTKFTLTPSPLSSTSRTAPAASIPASAAAWLQVRLCVALAVGE